jgi:hypothetical protein
MTGQTEHQERPVSGKSPNSFVRFLTVTLITLVGTTPLAVFLFVMSLVVSENVIYPAATLATAAIAALAAGWAATSLAGDEKRTDLGGVVLRNLVLAAVPAVAAAFVASSLDRSIWLISITLVYTSLTASLLAFRYRTNEATTVQDGKVTINWLVGTVVGVGVIIFVASLFGLTGA